MLRLSILTLLAAVLARAEDFQGSDHPLEYDQPPISYATTAPADPVAALQKRILDGTEHLEFDDTFGYLPALLKAFGISPASQLLVFSKTSAQRKLISPETPRALYFSDDVYIGYIPGAPFMEISTVDPALGGTFYTLEQDKVRRPKLTRNADCLSCHGGQRSLGVPGHFTRSIFTDPTGEINALEEVRDITQCTPLADRWAGWYLTGDSGTQPHRGNLIGEKDLALYKEQPLRRTNLTDLSQFFDIARYQVPTSDIVAHLLHTHQTHMHNYIARLNIEAREMLAAYGHVRYLHAQVDAFLRYLLFVEETPLTAPIVGIPEFQAAFAARAIRDKKGRSLRDLDLHTRLFRFPCSYLIYTPSFDAIAEPIREQILGKLYDLLAGKVDDPQFARLTPEDRTAILEILRETKPNLPAYWRE